MATTDEVLDCPMLTGNDAQAETVRDYLTSLLLAVWDEEEGFSGKRPFGNSGWSSDIIDALIAADLAGEDDDTDTMVRDAIKALR